MLIYLIRHGETDYNIENRYQGMWIESHLSERGRAQAKNASPLYADIPFDRIYVSAAERTRETAALLFPGRNDFIFRDDLRETDVGELAGHLASEFYELFGERYLRFKETKDYSIMGGESEADTEARAASALEAILKDDAERIAIVSHGGFIRPLLKVLTGIPLYSVAILPNCSAAIVEIKEGRGVLKQFAPHVSAESIDVTAL